MNVTLKDVTTGGNWEMSDKSDDVIVRDVTTGGNREVTCPMMLSFQPASSRR